MSSILLSQLGLPVGTGRSSPQCNAAPAQRCSWLPGSSRVSRPVQHQPLPLPCCPSARWWPAWLQRWQRSEGHLVGTRPLCSPSSHSHSQPEPASSRRSLGKARRTRLTSSRRSRGASRGNSPLEPSTTSPEMQAWGGHPCCQQLLPAARLLPPYILGSQRHPMLRHSQCGCNHEYRGKG